MSVKNLVPRFGAVLLPSGFAMDMNTLRVSERQQTENVTCYGGTVNAIYLGNGTPDQDISVTGFPFKGTAGSAVGFGNMAQSGGDSGASATFCFDNGTSVSGGSGGCAISGLYIVESVSLDTGRLVPAARTTILLKPASIDPTYTWATT